MSYVCVREIMLHSCSVHTSCTALCFKGCRPFLRGGHSCQFHDNVLKYLPRGEKHVRLWHCTEWLLLVCLRLILSEK